jgi:peptide/nickel transport system substrate-binding protein
MRKYIVKLTALLIIFIIIFTSCVQKKAPISTVKVIEANSIVYNLGNRPKNLVALDNNNIREKDILLMLFEGLVRIDESNKVVPGIAESWTISKDELSYTFNIRSNAVWSDGKEIIAKDFVDFFSTVLSPKTDNIYASILYAIFGAQEYKEGKRSFDGVAVRAVNDKTVEFKLNSPCSYFLDIMSMPVFVLRKFDSNLTDWDKNYKDISYSGPYKIEEIKSKGEALLVKNEKYYNKDEVKSEKISVEFIENSEFALAGFKSSKINVMADPPENESAFLMGAGEAVAVPIEKGVGLNFNLKKKGAASDVNFRKALANVINREQILENDLNGVGRAASAYIPNEKETKSNKSFFNMYGNTNLGMSYLKNSKYDKKEHIKLIYLEESEDKQLCEAVAKNIKDALDVSIECKGCNEEEFKEAMEKGDYDIVASEYTGLYSDSLAFLEQWCTNSNNYGYKNANFDSLVAKAKCEKDKVKRKELIVKAEELLLSDLPTIPIYYENLIVCKKSNIDGIYTTKEGNLKLDRAYVKTSK